MTPEEYLKLKNPPLHKLLMRIEGALRANDEHQATDLTTLVNIRRIVRSERTLQAKGYVAATTKKER